MGALHIEVVGSTGAHALAHLALLCRNGTGDAELQVLLDAIGDPTGETWAHLTGWCVPDIGGPTVEGLRNRLAATPARDVRRTILGATAWSWVNVVGADMIEAAVDNDPDATNALLADERYYAGNAAAALGTIVGWDADRTQEAFLAALDRYCAAYGDELRSVAGELDRAARDVREAIGTKGSIDAVAELTGYRYFPEPEADRVVLLLHGADRSLALAQHDGIRLIVHGRRLDAGGAALLARLGAALADENRVRLLGHVAEDGPLPLAPLMERSGLSRSTLHHHLAILRDAGLLAVEGNARAYRYVVHPDAAATWSRAFLAVAEPAATPTERREQ